MAQTKILVDSNSYFRLAQNIHPLLAEVFGKAEYCLYAHDELRREFDRQPRLQTKFEWFQEPAYVANRTRPLKLGHKEAKEIEATFQYMWAHVTEARLGPSRVDVRILATASELSLRMVTDDQDLLAMAEMYGVHALTTLELMKLMLDEQRIDMTKVRQVVAQWSYDRDTPANFRRDYRKLFGEDPPQE